MKSWMLRDNGARRCMTSASLSSSESMLTCAGAGGGKQNTKQTGQNEIVYRKFWAQKQRGKVVYVVVSDFCT